MSSNSPNPGKSYEKIVANIYRQFSETAEVIEDEHIIGKSGRNRQIDVALRTEVAGHSLLVVIECKDYKRPVGISQVDELIGKIDDIGAQMGVLVSDSGFDAGAIARAESNNNIRLVSVLDMENSQLRARIKLAVSVAFYELKSPNMSLMAEFQLNDAQLIEIFTQEQTRIHTGFYAWYNANTSDLKAGDHEYRQTFTIANDRKITATTTFHQSIQVFFNENVWVKGIGIYDALKKEVTKGEDFQRVVLDFPYIKANWREITGNEDKEKIDTWYRIISCY